jgi:hypothetical protein
MAIIQTTIFNLRNSVLPSVSDTYYVIDDGMQGNWFYDADDNYSNDNLGTILIGIAGARYKRIIDGYVNVKWFGAKGNNYIEEIAPNDDTIAIQNALDFISSSNYNLLWDSTNNYQIREFGLGTLFFPIGNYLITNTLYIGPFVKILGQTKGGNTSPFNKITNSGSVISSNFSQPIGENNITYNKWMFESSSYYTSKTITPGKFSEIAQIIPLIDYDDQKIVWTNGITIENISLNAGFLGVNAANSPFGGIKLTGTYYPLLRNVSIINTRIGIMLNACVYSEINNVFIYSFWYGIIITNCNVVSINSSFYGGSKSLEGSSYSPVLTNAEILNQDKYGNFPWDVNKFFMNEIDFNSTYKINNPNISKGKCGLVSYFGISVSINSVSFEQSNNGLLALDSVLSINSLYSEQLSSFGVISSGSRFTLKDLIFSSVPKPFYLGYFTFGDISNVNVGTYDLLFANINESTRLITFSKVLDFTNNGFIPKRVYCKEVVFMDETPIGFNLGNVFVDPLNGNDLNYGFTSLDPLKTLDGALFRVQNQTTLNPVHTIFLKSNDEGHNLEIIKDLSIKELKNCNLLITGYSDNKSKPVIKFDTINEKHEIGQILLNGNCLITFKDVDIFLFDPQGDSFGTQLVSFGLNNTFAKFVFSNVVFRYGIWYHIFESKLGNSNLEVKINDSTFTGSQYFTPFISSGPNIIVDCVQIGSSAQVGCWNNSLIIRNNL